MARLLRFIIAASVANAACYYPNGTDVNELKNIDSYKSCSDSDTERDGMCCRRTGDNADVCSNDGLCQNGNVIWRESCTDPSWKSEGCLKLCISGMGQIFSSTDDLYDMATKDVQIKQCDDLSYCCGAAESEMAISCCRNGQGVWLKDGQVVTTNPNGSTQSTTATGVSSTASTASSAPTSGPAQNQDSDSKTNTGTIAGAVVGGVGGLALVGAIVWFFLRQRATRTNKQQGFLGMTELHDNGYASPPHQGYASPPPQGYASPPPQDIIKYAYNAPKAELSNAHETVEIGASPVKERLNELPA